MRKVPMDLGAFIKGVNAKTPFSGSLKFREPMSRHTTFKTGGPADLWVRPGKKVFRAWVPALLDAAEAGGVPVFILGKGANLLVSDQGIRGIVLDTGAWKGAEQVRAEQVRANQAPGEQPAVEVLSGTPADRLAQWLAFRGLSALEFLAGLPGSMGGALYMNARCYGKSVSDVLGETEILDESRRVIRLPFRGEDFSYKKSPFQNRNILILSARFRAEKRAAAIIRKEMAGYRRDRREKGHFRYPSAGSVFKNNPAFGAPTGKIIADLGLRGLRKGGAAVAPWHGNFIINTGSATSRDIRFLMDELSRRVREERGFDLEPEIIFAGEW